MPIERLLVEGESPRNPERMTGRTWHHRIVHFAASDHTLVGRYVPVRITEAFAHSTVGDLLAEDEAETPVPLTSSVGIKS